MHVEIKPEMLRWARERAGIELGALSKSETFGCSHYGRRA